MRKLTAFVIIVTFLTLVAFDVVAWLSGGEGVTLSRVWLDWATDRPWLVFGLGYLSGHLTWPQKVKG